MIVNGKKYPMYSQFIERKDEWIGNTLDDYDMGGHMSTIITDITLEPNGEESAYFSIVGEDFTCGFGVHNGGIGAGADGCITFHGYGGHEFKIETVKSEQQ